MLISAADVVEMYGFLALRFRWRRAPDVVGVEEALREADSLAGERIEDAPAALLFALIRRPMDLGDASERLPYVLVENLARRLGAEVRLDPLAADMRTLRERILARDPERRATFDDVRAFLAARTRSLP